MQLIITYHDVINKVRQMPFDQTQAVVIGRGFVNSALNTVHCLNEDEAIMYALDSIARPWEEQGFTTQFGVFVTPGVFLTREFIEVYGNAVPLTVSEHHIIKYLAMPVCRRRPVEASVIARYCLNGCGGERSNSVAAHISRINSKLSEHYGSRLIRSINRRGYYI